MVRPSARSFRAAGALASLIALAAIGQRPVLAASRDRALGNWPQFHGEASHVGVNPFERVLTPSNVRDLVEAWRGPRGYINSSAVVSNGTVYVTEQDDVVAFDASSGAELWNVAISGGVLDLTPAVAHGMVLAMSQEFFTGDWVNALDAGDGHTIWRSQVIGGDSTPTVAGNTVYLNPQVSNRLYALDVDTGVERWQSRMASLALGPPTVADGRVFIGLNTGKVEAFSASTGHPLWIQSTGAYYVEAAPAVAGGMVFAGDTSGVLHAYDEATGSSVWTFQVPGSYPSIAASPAVWRGVVYQGAQNGVLYALDARGGDLRWSTPVASIIDSAPAVANGVVFVGADRLPDYQNSGLFALDARTGSQLWSAVTGNYVDDSAPAVSNGSVYITSANLIGYRLPSSLTTAPQD